jgi:hypothetical protein
MWCDFRMLRSNREGSIHYRKARRSQQNAQRPKGPEWIAAEIRKSQEQEDRTVDHAIAAVSDIGMHAEIVRRLKRLYGLRCGSAICLA